MFFNPYCNRKFFFLLTSLHNRHNFLRILGEKRRTRNAKLARGEERKKIIFFAFLPSHFSHFALALLSPLFA